MASDDPLLPLPDEPVCGIYRHYKGNLYEVKGIVMHSESLEPMVLYRPMGEPGVDAAVVHWVRPQAMWSELVELESGIKVPRFSLLESRQGLEG